MADTEKPARPAVWAMPPEDPAELAALLEFWRTFKAPPDETQQAVLAELQAIRAATERLAATLDRVTRGGGPVRVRPE